MNEYGLVERTNGFTLNASAIRTSLLQFFKHGYYSYFTLQIMKADMYAIK